MIDSVLKGSGNSRFLKSAVPAGTSWADALAMLQAGTFPIDFNGINTEGFQQVGTPLNKANLLKDATAAQIGLPPSTTPDGMFQALGNTGELHVWRKVVTLSEGIPAVQAGYTLGSTTSIDIFKNARPTTSFKCYWKVADSVSVDNDGNVALVSPDEISIYYNQGDTLASSFRGKFAQYSRTESGGLLNDKNIYWIPQGASIGFLNDSGIYRVYMSAQLVSGHPYTPEIPAGTTTTYPVSTNPKAYQEGDDAKAAGYTLGDAISGHFRMSDTAPRNAYIYKYASSIAVDENGVVSLQNPLDLNFNSESYQGYESTVLPLISGKFLYYYRRDSMANSSDAPDTQHPFNVTPSAIVYIPADATITYQNTYPAGFYLDKYQPVTGYAAIPAGTTIEYLGKLGDKARVQVVSYVGTGTYGSGNPNSLMFDFVPKLVVIRANGAAHVFVYTLLFLPGTLTKTFQENGYVNLIGDSEPGLSNAYARVSGRTLAWYSNGYNLQANYKGAKYTAVAIG